MADAEEKPNADKLAAARLAAKKRAEQMKKQKSKKTGTKKDEKPEATAEVPKDDEAPEPTKAENIEAEADTSTSKDIEETDETQQEEPIAELKSEAHQRKPSISVQSKMRSSSFRQSASGGPLSPGYGFSPDGDTAPEIYRKQAIKIEELEREKQRLTKEVTEGEKRWKKAEEELEELREADDNTAPKEPTPRAISSVDSEKYKAEIAALQRQISQLQAQSARASRHGSSPSVSVTAPAEYEAQLASKISTIESMEIELSNLRAHLAKAASGASEKEQITALEEKLARSERSAQTAQRELGDLKKNLDRTTEKAVKEGSERISAETKLRSLEREAAEAKSHNEELQKKVEALEKKVATLATLHKEHDARSQAQKRDREKAEKDASELRSKLAASENENLNLKEEKERLRKRDAQGIDDDGVDELENEERLRLEKKVRDLEGEVHELRRGVWRDRRGQLEAGEDPSSGHASSPGARFTDIDLGGLSPSRRRSSGHGHGHGGGKGIGDFFASGFNAITGSGNVNGGAGGHDDGLLDDDGDMDFDEDAFRAAQEEEARKRIERIKEVKRGLKNWEGWRLDLVENRRGGGEGIGEIFEV